MKIQILSLVLWALLSPSAPAQDVPIVGFTVDATGRARVEVASAADRYYVLYVREVLPSGPEAPVSMALGQASTTTLTDGLAAYSREHYRVAQFARSAPGDLDLDGIDDVTEFQNQGQHGPFNMAAAIAPENGTVSIPDRATFEAMSYQGKEIVVDRHLADLEFVKFYLLDMNTNNMRLYFMNTETHRTHGSFSRVIGVTWGEGEPDGTMRGEIVYHPHVIGPNGGLGVYRFEFEPNVSFPFADVQKAYELIARNMPILRNNLAYYPMPNAAMARYQREKALFDASRVAVILDKDIFAKVDYVPFNLAEGYGRLQVMNLNERPHPRDIVLYEALPNELSRVGGIITTVPQTPLSHVNLRAIQDGVPNAYIPGARENALIAALIGKIVYYRTDEDGYEIREATLAEVEAHYAARRPSEPQIPVRDLSAKAITPLADVKFADWTRFGVKAANVATLRTFGFPEGTIPDGFAIPFSFYDAFMKHNGFYEKVQALLDDPAFQNDYDVQEARLKELRDEIKAADMPLWMLEQLATMQASFPAGFGIRCRSSTNNEDLPGFSGAGLYDSFTQHPDEGHIAKSIKQVYASLWTFRAFDERQYYRIDHLATAMGVLVHPNYEDELANGVGVTIDPIYGSERTYYLNTQLGEDLVTNPDALSIPEEILLGAAPGSGYNVLRSSNQVAAGERIMSEAHLNTMRDYLGVIDARFRALYGIRPAEPFAMEIEYKITKEGVLDIKQARPWVFESGTTGSSVFLPLAMRPGGTQSTSGLSGAGQKQSFRPN